MKYNKNNQLQKIADNKDILYSGIENIFVIRLLKPVLNIHADKKDFPNKQDKTSILMFDFYGNVYILSMFSYSERVKMDTIHQSYDGVSPELQTISVRNGIFDIKLIFKNTNNSLYIISPSRLTYTLTDT